MVIVVSVGSVENRADPLWKPTFRTFIFFVFFGKRTENLWMIVENFSLPDPFPTTFLLSSRIDF